MDIFNHVVLAPMTWPVQQLFLQSPPLLLPFETNLPLLPTSRHKSSPSIHGYINKLFNLLQPILLRSTTTHPPPFHYNPSSSVPLQPNPTNKHHSPNKHHSSSSPSSPRYHSPSTSPSSTALTNVPSNLDTHRHGWQFRRHGLRSKLGSCHQRPNRRSPQLQHRPDQPNRPDRHGPQPQRYHHRPD